MDLMDLDNKIKTIILVACDTDFVPILNKLKEKGIKVILYYYTDKIRKSKFSMSNHLIDACTPNCKFMIKKEHFEKSYRSKEQKIQINLSNSSNRTLSESINFLKESYNK